MTKLTNNRWLLPQMLAGCLALAGTAAFVSPAQAQTRPTTEQRTTNQATVEHRNFDDHDRQVAKTWYDGHRTNEPIGLRDRDRLAVDIEPRFTVGFSLDRNLRGQIHDVPLDLRRQLGPAPRGDRYVLIDGHLVLINSRYEIVDVIHLGHDWR